MISTILFLISRRYYRHYPEKAAALQSQVKMVSRIFGLIIVCLAISVFSRSQVKKLEYQIKRNGDVVGNIQFSQLTTGSRTTMKLESEVKTRFIFLFTAKADEEAVFDNGIMTWSSIYRKLNSNVKADKKTKAKGNSYTIFKGSKTETLNNYPILYNMLSIYTVEPANISKVYSDNFQQFLDIQKINAQHYKIKFPDGNYNEYYYDGGICSRVEVHHSLYNASIERTK